MMSVAIKKISGSFSVSPQLNIEDVEEIAQLGFKTIINNRPDNEGGVMQPASAQIQAAAEKLGMSYYYIPVIPNAIQDHQVAAFEAAYAFATKPVLGFCRTGNRASRMYELSQLAKDNTPKGLIAWLKRKCLITRLFRWCKAKYQSN